MAKTHRFDATTSSLYFLLNLDIPGMYIVALDESENRKGTIHLCGLTICRLNLCMWIHVIRGTCFYIFLSYYLNPTSYNCHYVVVKYMRTIINRLKCNNENARRTQRTTHIYIYKPTEHAEQRAWEMFAYWLNHPATTWLKCVDRHISLRFQSICEASISQVTQWI